MQPASARCDQHQQAQGRCNVFTEFFRSLWQGRLTTAHSVTSGVSKTRNVIVFFKFLSKKVIAVCIYYIEYNMYYKWHNCIKIGSM